MEPGTPCAIVVCDDQSEFRQLLSAVLGLESGIEIVGEASDGREAIDVVRELRPDVLVLDVAMPVMDGLEALSHIRTASPETRVVMLTGLTAESVRQRALDGGASVFIEKGTDVETIVGAVIGVCERA